MIVAMGGLGTVVVGTASSVADQLEEWIQIADVDGFNLSYVDCPGTFVDVVEKLVPELQRRGIFQSKYVGKTMREGIDGEKGNGRLRPDHPAWKIIRDKVPELQKRKHQEIAT